MKITWLYLAHVLFGADPLHYHVTTTTENDTKKNDSVSLREPYLLC